MPQDSAAARGEERCPICGAQLSPTGPAVPTEELFRLWEPQHRFPQEVIDAHVRQAASTRLHACADCGFEIFLPLVVGTAAFYESLIDDPAAEYYAPTKWDFGEALKDARGLSSAIEIGCGPGHFLAQLAALVPGACGAEFNSRALEQARSKGLTVFGPGEESDRRRGSFDAAFAFHVLEHVSDPMAFLEEMVAWVRPGGAIGISVPDRDGPVRFIEPCVQNMPPHHVTRWQRRTLEAAAAKLDLKVRRIAYEPLIYRDHYYYSTYWVRQAWSERTPLGRFVRRSLERMLPVAFRWLFGALAIAGVRSFPLLRGQAIYVLMSRRDS